MHWNKSIIVGTVAAVLFSTSTLMAGDAPLIIKQPESQFIRVGDSATFSVKAVTPKLETPVEMVWIQPGSFFMGSDEGEEYRRDNETRHEVFLTQGFWMSKFEITEAQYKKVMATCPSENGDNMPVCSVSWENAMTFCEYLTDQERKAGKLPSGYKYALPTEAQWEYACRAGTTGMYNVDGDVNEIGWFNGNSENTIHEGGQKKPNAWGLYDMHGNAWEWCRDSYWPDLGTLPAVDPYMFQDNESYIDVRVSRGGSFTESSAGSRSARRDYYGKTRADRDFGIRLVLVHE
ncbi:MAG: SUMF1/EgtB/PvdO family nonheme iron enzyme [Verrucomicrobia bacterium]|nr:SUMF1/EgtB/PvdO family nonheme iron enzyme [Verrucomicrobiota bacterium]